MAATAIIITIAILLFVLAGIDGLGTNENIMEKSDAIGMMSGSMMGQAPRDAIIEFNSTAEVSAGSEAQVRLLVLDKQTRQAMTGAQVIIGIEKGLPMSTMDMQLGMFAANEEKNGAYSFVFTPEKGYYTLHVHVIPQGKSMHSMMDNHVDFVMIAA